MTLPSLSRKNQAISSLPARVPSSAQCQSRRILASSLSPTCSIDVMTTVCWTPPGSRVAQARAAGMPSRIPFIEWS